MRLAGEIRPQASVFFWGLLVGLHACALLLLNFPGVSGVALGPGLVAVCASAMLAYRAWSAARGLVITLTDEGQIHVRGPGCEPQAIALNRESKDYGFFVVLCWRRPASGGMLRLCLTKAALTDAEWRLLRSWLRWRAFNADSSSAPYPSASEHF
ncbi:protein YgfX [Niveibacterium umoris]|uniref:Toxin CptA n=1 Tax=Niveibacterium umoris TaxID=1193620 RepID=A0A840BJ03_9RHOO|nr:protein YgfX [Niveibacterium umoris]MBB4010896.1 hypothetical protein [Niveibacterium umoris]